MAAAPEGRNKSKGEIMYIPDFWVGVGCTLLAEILTGLVWITISVQKHKKEEPPENNSNKDNQ